MEHKECGMAKLVKAASVLTTICTGVVMVGMWMSKRARELEKNNVGASVKKYLAFMNGRLIKLGKEEVDEISIHAYAGGVTLDMTRAEFTKDMDVKIKSVMSGIVIKVPPMVRVVLDGANVMSGFANMVPTYERKDIPTVYVYAESVMGGVAVMMVPENE